MKHRIEWLIKRQFLKRQLNIDSEPSSLVIRSTLAGYNYLGRNTQIVDSSIGKFSYINNQSIVILVEMGDYCSIGPQCLIGGLGQHPTDRASTHRMFYSRAKSIWAPFCHVENYKEKTQSHIGHDVWIGARCIIMDGVKIGNGAILAAGSILTKDAPPYTIMAGTPAKPIRLRIPQNEIDKLERDQWWNWDLARLKAATESGYFSRAFSK